MKIPLILTACIVNWNLAFVQSLDSLTIHQAGISRANGRSELQENFQNLFDSIAKNDNEKSEMYRNALERYVKKERQAFDAVKEKIQFARGRKFDKKRSLYNDAVRNMLAVKRETNEKEMEHADRQSEKVNHSNATSPNHTITRENATQPTATPANQTIPKNAHKFTVTRYTMITPTVLQLTLKRSDGSPYKFIAGQFIAFLLPHDGKLVRRCYSLANSPEQTDEIEVAIAPVEGGFATNVLFNLKVGDEVLGTGPQGKLVLDETFAVSHIVLVATSTGVAPYRSMLPVIAKKLNKDKNLKVTVLLGVRHVEDLLYEEDFVSFSKKHEGFSFRGYVSRAKNLNTSHHYSGYVQTALEEFRLDPNTDLVYLCGNPHMVDDCAKLLKSWGFPPQRLIREKYVSRGV